MAWLGFVLRILFASLTRQLVGGTESYLRAAFKRFSTQHSLAFAFAEGEETPSVLSDHDIDISSRSETLPRSPIETYQVKEKSQEAGVQWVDEWKPDVIINNGVQRATWVRALAKKYPMVFFPHDYYATCVSGTKFTQRPHGECHRAFGLSCLFHYHLNGCGGKSPLTMVRNFAKARSFRKNFPLYARTVVVSKRMRDEMIREGIPAGKVDVIPYFPSSFEPMASPPKTASFNNCLLFLGRLVRQKGWNDAIEAVRIASDRLAKPFTLEIAGEGPDLNSLSELAKVNPRIQVHGKLETPSIRDLLGRVDALLVPSRWAEPFGKVGLEAASQGVPSIAYPVGGISEWLKDGKTGLFAETESPDPLKLADKICELYSNEEKWNRLRLGAWSHASQFTLDNHLEHFFASMEKAIRDFRDK